MNNESKSFLTDYFKNKKNSLAQKDSELHENLEKIWPLHLVHSMSGIRLDSGPSYLDNSINITKNGKMSDTPEKACFNLGIEKQIDYNTEIVPPKPKTFTLKFKYTRPLADGPISGCTTLTTINASIAMKEVFKQFPTITHIENIEDEDGNIYQ